MGQESWRGGAAVVVCLCIAFASGPPAWWEEGRLYIINTASRWYMSCLNATSELLWLLCRKLRCGKGGWGGGPPCPVAPSHVSLTLPLVCWGFGKPLELQPSQTFRHTSTAANVAFSPKRPRCLPTAAPEACIPRRRTSSRRQVSVPTPHRHQASHALALPRPRHGPRRRAQSESEHSVGGPTPLSPLQSLQHGPARPSPP